MNRLGERRQVLLFLAAVCAPSLALVFLTVRLIERDRELVGKRLEDQRRAAVARLAESLLDRLSAMRRAEAERLAGRAPGPPDSAIALTAPVRDGRLALPWEVERPVIANALIRAGERQELEQGMLEEAARSYERALAARLSSAQAGYAKLLRARALYKLDRRAQAIAGWKALLRTPVEIRDEDGIPLSLRAADLLADAGTDSAAALEAARASLTLRWPSPEACYLAARLAGRLGDKALAAGVQHRVRLIEQAQSLQDEYPRLRLSPAAWLPYSGEELWLVSANEVPPAVIAVAAAKALDGARLLTARDSGAGEWLGDAFPGLRAAMPASDLTPDAGDSLQQQLYYAAVLLVAGSTIFGAYLLWRDMRREMRLAEMRAQFVSNVSHELKTPLTAIRMFAETLQMGRSADREEYLGTIVNECERLSRLVDDVLQFSRIEQGRKTYNFARTDVADVVDAAARAIAYPLSRQGFTLDVSVAGDLPPARLDRDAIEQAILNLLGNAIKYSGESRSVELRLRREGGRAAIDVADRGIGIAPEEQKRIFEKFYRAPTRENQLISGTGLGLALVEQIVAAHGGEMRVRSRPGEGSTFTILLPLEEKS